MFKQIYVKLLSTHFVRKSISSFWFEIITVAHLMSTDGKSSRHEFQLPGTWVYWHLYLAWTSWWLNTCNPFVVYRKAPTFIFKKEWLKLCWLLCRRLGSSRTVCFHLSVMYSINSVNSKSIGVSSVQHLIRCSLFHIKLLGVRQPFYKGKA